jgi:hypothetical protein
MLICFQSFIQIFLIQSLAIMSRQLDESRALLNDAASRNSKRTGELSEAAFLHKAVGLGFRVTKPWGDSERYDFVLDSGRRLWRVQIKCTASERAGGYHIQPIHFVYGKNKVVYTADDIDVLAAHIVPLDVWYVVPVGRWRRGPVCGFIRMTGARRRGLRNIARRGMCFVARRRRVRMNLSRPARNRWMTRFLCVLPGGVRCGSRDLRDDRELTRKPAYFFGRVSPSQEM